MNKTLPGVRTTDAEIDAAIKRGRRALHHAVVRASYDKRADRVVLVFNDKTEVRLPRRNLEGLESATPAQLAQIEIEGPGTGIVWRALDVAHYVPGLLMGILGTRAWMSELARRAGGKSTARKAATSRANGAKGGRPASKIGER